MGTAIVGLVLVAVVSAIIKSLVKSKKSGKSSCGPSCAHCAMGGKCHKKERSGLHATVLEIDGMMCSMCESHINEAIRNNFSVKSVKSSHKTGITQIESEEPLDEERVRAVIKETGYELKNISSS
ncbi:MAG: heavy-metal-associated domain-containing protein [Treponema sp.]|nr:heavy-metal-associated domain-containing protein [Treponema sp.]